MLFFPCHQPIRRRPDSEHEFAQRVTWAALERALDEGRRADVEVELLGAVYPVDVPAVRPSAVTLPHLSKCISDIVPLERPMPLPLCADVLRLALEHGRGEYVIFTNMDICPQPYFYPRPGAHGGQPVRCGLRHSPAHHPGELHHGGAAS